MQSVIERIEHTIAGYERAGEAPDRFANDYLIHALVCLSGAQYCEAHDHLLRGIEEDDDAASIHEPLTLADHRVRFEQIKAILRDTENTNVS